MRSFSRTERTVYSVLLGIFVISAIGLLWNINRVFLVEIPARGGSFTEGVISAPRFINPLLAISDTDRDLTFLVYSGLMRPSPDGTLIPDLAEKYTISEDGLIYTFTLKKGLVWHDGTPLTSDDVLFTITKVQDSVLKSPKRASWEGVTVQKKDDRVIQFTLAQPYSPFLENTTLGILPKHIWGDISSEQFGFSKFNIEPIGSGPFVVDKIKKEKTGIYSTGIPIYYDFKSFKYFALGEPYLSNIRIAFYANEDKLFRAFEKGEIELMNAIRAEKAWELENKKIRVERYVLPRIFGVFFNQNQNTIFTNRVVRKALEMSIDREKIIDEVLFGYGTAIRGPLPPGALGYTPFTKDKDNDNKNNPKKDDDSLATTTPKISSVDEAIALLLKNGWKINEKTGIRERKTKKETLILQFSITTSETEELKHTTQVLKEVWESLGARVDLKVFNTGDLNQNVIRPRKYDALFFGEIIGRESDPFAFWHSSQRNDPGLNIALYANITADKLLEDGRVNFNRDARSELYKQFEEEIAKDVPAVFIYSPDFVYVLPERIQRVTLGTITTPAERFMDIHRWFIETDKVWKIFARDSRTIRK